MAGKTMKASVLIGGSISSTFRAAMSQSSDGLKRIGQAITDVDKRQRLLGNSIQVFGRQGKNVDGLRRQYDELTRASERLRSAQSRLARAQQAVDANLARRSELRGQLFDALALGATVAAPVMSAVNFESAMADVRKVVDFDTAEQFAAMGREVRDMAKVLPMAAADIAQIVAAGGQAGLARGELTAFAESAVKVGVAFGMTADEAGQMMSELRSAFRMNQAEVNTLADKMNLLANTTAASESRIASVVRRVGPLGEVAGAASGEIAALGATLISMGVAEEVAATGIQNLMLGLVAGEAATKKQRNAFKALGLDVTKVAKSMQRDASGTITDVLARVAKLDDYKRASILQQIFGRESIKAIAPLLNNVATLQENLAKVTEEERYAGAVQREYASRAATSANNLQLFKNRIHDIGIVIGNTLLPALNATLDVIGPVVSKIGEFAEANPRMTRAIVGTAAGLASLRIAAIAGGYAMTFVKAPFLQISAALARFRAARAVGELGRIGSAAVRVGGAFRWVSMAVAAIGGGPVAIAVGALVGAALLVRKYWEPIKAFFSGLWQGFSAGIQPALGELRTALTGLQPAWDRMIEFIGDAWNWLGKLLEPITGTKEGLEAAVAVGVFFGKVIANSFSVFLKGVTLVVKAAVKMSEIIGRAFDVIADKLKPILAGLKWFADTGGAIGATVRGWFGDDKGTGRGPQPALAGGAPMPPALPPMASARAQGATTVQQSNTFHITQQPGESTDALARRIAEEQKRAEETKRRGRLTD